MNALTGEFRIPIYLASVLLVINIFVWHGVFSVRADAGEVRVAFLDVGQGDAIYIETPDGRDILVDGGSSGRAVRALGEVMPIYDRSIDLVVGTHADEDHIGGLPGVFDRFAVVLAVFPEMPDGVFHARALIDRARTEGSVVIRPRAGQVINLGEGVYLDVLFPDRAMPINTRNTASVVMRLRYGATSVLLTGDIPAAVEEYLAAIHRTDIRSTILKVAHHGSDTSSSPTFIDAVDPQTAVIQAGADNPYGHPHKNILDRLRNSGAEVVCACDMGTVIFESDGVNVEFIR